MRPHVAVDHLLVTERGARSQASAGERFSLFVRDVIGGTQARTRTSLAANRQLVGLDWRLGQLILDRPESVTYGTKLIGRRSVDLREAFPETRGLG